jgi:hypothetical protein
MMMFETHKRKRTIPQPVVKGQAYKGVQIRALISDNGKLIYLGTYATAEEAARAYDEACVRLHGDAAVTNESMGLLESKQ